MRAIAWFRLPVLALALSASAALAAPAPAPAYDPQIPDLVEGLVVQALTPGPAWWKLSRGESTVWILGTPPYLPTSLAWDKAPLQRRMQGARLLLTPLYLELQPYRLDSRGRPLPFTTDLYQRRGELVSDLPPATQARLTEAFESLGRPPPRPGSSIIFATRQLSQALFDRVPLSRQALSDQLTAAARPGRVPIQSTRLSTISAATDYAGGLVGPKIACLEATLAVAESGANPLRRGLEAWAVGDLPSAMAVVGCVGAKGGVYQQEAAVIAPLLESYLRTPGKVVAAVELIPLLMKDGVIERLKADGYTVEGPDSREVAGE